MGAQQNQGRSLGFSARAAQRMLDRCQVVSVVDRSRMPAIRLEAARAILSEGDRGAGGERYVIVIVQINQFAKPQMTGERGRLRRNAFHQVAVADDTVSMMI